VVDEVGVVVAEAQRRLQVAAVAAVAQLPQRVDNAVPHRQRQLRRQLRRQLPQRQLPRQQLRFLPFRLLRLVKRPMPTQRLPAVAVVPAVQELPLVDSAAVVPVVRLLQPQEVRLRHPEDAAVPQRLPVRP
jgi:hypothetical protein